VKRTAPAGDAESNTLTAYRFAIISAVLHAEAHILAFTNRKMMAYPSKPGQARTENCWRSIRAVCIATAMKLK
jgi:hypothetical protein